MEDINNIVKYTFDTSGSIQIKYYKMLFYISRVLPGKFIRKIVVKFIIETLAADLHFGFPPKEKYAESFVCLNGKYKHFLTRSFEL